MQRFIFTLLMGCMAFSAMAQKAYTDSITAYQRKYISELYPIIQNDTAYIQFHPINPAYKIKACVELLDTSKTFLLITSSGKTKEATRYALLSFTLSGKQHKLYAYQLLQLKNNPATANLLFLPFIDATSGKTSYRGGRYIDFPFTDIQNNQVIIDFNKAYNPYCAFTTGYNCPIPPKENTLTVPVNAGEAYNASHFDH